MPNTTKGPAPSSIPFIDNRKAGANRARAIGWKWGKLTSRSASRSPIMARNAIAGVNLAYARRTSGSSPSPHSFTSLIIVILSDILIQWTLNLAPRRSGPTDTVHTTRFEFRFPRYPPANQMVPLTRSSLRSPDRLARCMQYTRNDLLTSCQIVSADYRA